MEQDYIFVSADEIIEFDFDGSQVAEPPLPAATPPILSEEEQALADAVKRYQIDHQRGMLTWRDIFEIVQSLGYRKVEPPGSNGEPKGAPSP